MKISGVRANPGQWYEMTAAEMKQWESSLKSDWFAGLDDAGKLNHFRAGALLGVDVLNAASNYIVSLYNPKPPGVLTRIWRWLF